MGAKLEVFTFALTRQAGNWMRAGSAVSDSGPVNGLFPLEARRGLMVTAGQGPPPEPER